MRHVGGDIHFPVEWADWLSNVIAGVTRQVRFKDARIFFPEERPEAFNR